MAENHPATVLRLPRGAAALRDRFLAWQCRLREQAMRRRGGRPSAGMRPMLEGGAAAGARLTVLLLPGAARAAGARFRHMARRTQDPRARYEAALELFSGDYFQNPDDFSDRLTALFGDASDVAAGLARTGACTLRFAEGGEGFRIPAAVERLEVEAPEWQASYWHNALFNPRLPAQVTILAFAPRWIEASAEQPPAKDSGQNLP